MRPITPLVGCDIFACDPAHRVLLVRRSDNGLWALPGGCQELDETPAQCAVRECLEETGYTVAIRKLLGIFSSLNYPYIHYPRKENRFSHILFSGQIMSGSARLSAETLEVAFFHQSDLPPLSDGHELRIQVGFSELFNPAFTPVFE